MLQALFAADHVEHQRLAGIAARQLMARHGLDAGTDPAIPPGLVGRLAADTFFLRMLDKVFNTSADLERVLVRLRRGLLFDYRRDGRLTAPLADLAAAVALQSWNNGYLLFETPEEGAAVEDLGAWLGEAWLGEAWLGEVTDGNAGACLVFGMYRPLAKLGGAGALAGKDPCELPERLRALAVRSLHEPAEERRLVRELPALKEPSSRGARAVRAQYDEHPYPRWLGLGPPRRPLGEELARRFPGFAYPAEFADVPLRILVPGCGTGRHPLGLAAGNPGAEVTAVDLSSASLAYGLRKARELGIANVRFVQGDLHDLEELGRTFHHVDCVGVLHHAADPLAAWGVLERVLEPGGTLHAGVFGELALLRLRYLRRLWSERAGGTSDDALRRFRHEIFTGKRYGELARHLVADDFYDAGMFRDVLFSDHEHRYTLAEIGDLLAELDLDFLGFDPPGRLKEAYLRSFPDDPHHRSFERWRRFEPRYAGTFLLYELYARKRAGSDVC